jgi:flagellar biosynthesis/type III secretory pathway protein FliH
MRRHIILIFSLFLCTNVYASDVDYGLIQSIPDSYARGQEQAERINQMRLQNQMMQMEINRQGVERRESAQADKAFQDGYDTGYKAGFDVAMTFNQMTLEELQKMRGEIIDKFSPQSSKYQQLIPLIDWRIGQIQKMQHTPLNSK